MAWPKYLQRLYTACQIQFKLLCLESGPHLLLLFCSPPFPLFCSQITSGNLCTPATQGDPLTCASAPPESLSELSSLSPDTWKENLHFNKTSCESCSWEFESHGVCKAPASLQLKSCTSFRVQLAYSPTTVHSPHPTWPNNTPLTYPYTDTHVSVSFLRTTTALSLCFSCPKAHIVLKV